MEEKRDTIGKISSDLIVKAPESRDPIELQREMTQEFLDNLSKCITENEPKLSGDFYVVIINKNERLMPNVFRNYFFARQSCPSPQFDESVFKYNRTTGDVVFLWSIPSKDACLHLKDNQLYVAKEERQLLEYVLGFFDGSLLKYAKKLNGEKEDSPFLA